MIEFVTMTDREKVSWRKKINPLWWLMNGESWTAPTENNGAPYIPEVTNQFMRNFYWWCRNPIANFVGFVIGVEDKNYQVYGPYPVLQTTKYDANPPQYGWHWTVIKLGLLRLPFVSYSGKRILWYLGWRPASGGFGFKFNVHF